LIENKIVKLLEERFLQDDLNDCFIIEIKESQKGSKLEVFLESDSGLNFNKCRIISRYLEAAIEEQQLLPEKYILEVSSPGIGEPLKFFRQYKNNLGRMIEVLYGDEEKVKGRLEKVEEKTISVMEIVKGPHKGKVKELGTKEIPFEHITKAKIKVSF